ncbi:MAG: TonB-dependent receptor, partial [Cyclobacteriaceae bacterium]|nr:TonB-dependent receptor [Cyclobacteriaceae bacterium]
SGNKLFGGISGYLNTARDYYDGNEMYVPNTRSNSYSVKMFGGYRNTNGLFSLYYDYNKLRAGITNEGSINLIKENSRKNEAWYQDLDNHVLASKNQLFFNKLKLDIDLSYQFNNRNLFGNPESPVFKLVDMSLNNYTWQVKGQYDFSQKRNLIIVSQGLIQNSKNGTAPVYVLPDYSLSGNSIAGLWQCQFGENTFYQIGLRYDYKVIHAPEQNKSGISTDVLEAFNETYGNVSFSSGFTWKLHEHMLLRGNIASAYRTPSIAELLQDGIHANRYEIGNRDFVPQRNIEGDIGIHFHSDKLAVDFSTFYNRIFDYIFLAPTNDTTDIGMDIYRYNQNNATLYGIEFFSEYSLLSWLKVNAGYAHVYAQQDNGAYLPFIPQDKININFLASKTGNGFFRNTRVGINPLIAFDQNRPHEFETRTEHYFLLNAFVKTKLQINKQAIELGLFANNLLNTNYYDHLSTLKELGYYNMGRNISLRLKIPISIN